MLAFYVLNYVLLLSLPFVYLSKSVDLEVRMVALVATMWIKEGTVIALFFMVHFIHALTCQNDE